MRLCKCIKLTDNLTILGDNPNYRLAVLRYTPMSIDINMSIGIVFEADKLFNFYNYK